MASTCDPKGCVLSVRIELFQPFGYQFLGFRPPLNGESYTVNGLPTDEVTVATADHSVPRFVFKKVSLDANPQTSQTTEAQAGEDC